jgi:hypothetical protein
MAEQIREYTEGDFTIGGIFLSGTPLTVKDSVCPVESNSAEQ